MATTPPELPHLWHFRLSHYNEKVRWALDHKRIPHRRTALIPALHIPRALWVSGQRRLPILVIDGRAHTDSTHIIAEIERRWPDAPLYPADPAQRERALAIEHWFDEEVAPPLRRLFWSTYLDDADATARLSADGFGAGARVLFKSAFAVLRPAMKQNMGVRADLVAQARQRLDEASARIEQELQPSGYLVGDSFSVADLTAAAVMTAVLRPAQYPYPIPEPWPAALSALRDAVKDKPGCRWVYDLYQRLRPPSAEVA